MTPPPDNTPASPEPRCSRCGAVKPNVINDDSQWVCVQCANTPAPPPDPARECAERCACMLFDHPTEPPSSVLTPIIAETLAGVTRERDAWQKRFEQCDRVLMSNYRDLENLTATVERLTRERDAAQTALAEVQGKDGAELLRLTYEKAERMTKERDLLAKERQEWRALAIERGNKLDSLTATNARLAKENAGHQSVIVGFSQECDKLRATNARLRGALENLVNRLEFIHADSHYKSVWSLYYVHGGDYSNGPKYDKELVAAKSALADSGPDPVAELRAEIERLKADRESNYIARQEVTTFCPECSKACPEVGRYYCGECGHTWPIPDVADLRAECERLRGELDEVVRLHNLGEQAIQNALADAESERDRLVKVLANASKWRHSEDCDVIAATEECHHACTCGLEKAKGEV